MDAAPYDPTALDEAEAIIVAELCDEVAADELATIPFCLPTPPQPGVALVVVAGLGIAVFAFAAGYCVATVVISEQGEVTLFAMLGFVFCVAAAWSQLIGVFRPHGQRANFAGNVLIGSAAMVAAGLTAFPMIAGQPILLNQLLGYGGMTVFLAIAGHLNLVWSQQLRSAGWRAPRGWTFSLRELLAMFTVMALACAGYLLCTRLETDAQFRERQLHEIWRMQRISDAEALRRRVAPGSLPTPTGASNHE